MKLHTSLSGLDVQGALSDAQSAGKITSDVDFVGYREGGSRTHARRFDLQLGTYDKHSLPAGTVDQYGRKMHVRRYKNTGQHGASTPWTYPTGESVWAATWDEWGWFIAEIMRRDPSAVFGTYRGVDSFNAQTGHKFAQQNA